MDMEGRERRSALGDGRIRTALVQAHATLLRMEDKVAKTDGAARNCSMSFFALSFLQKVR
jgi:hypothetical protein